MYAVKCEILQTEMHGTYEFDKWIAIVREALSCLDFNTLSWNHLPCNGGYYEQDEWIIKIWEYIKYCYSKSINSQEIIEALERKRAKGTNTNRR